MSSVQGLIRLVQLLLVVQVTAYSSSDKPDTYYKTKGNFVIPLLAMFLIVAAGFGGYKYRKHRQLLPTPPSTSSDKQTITE